MSVTKACLDRFECDT